jgi:uncharacterized tellurite resistance protein B-like protein
MPNTPQRLWQLFYQRTAYMAYAVAAADKHVSPSEIIALKREISEYWLGIEQTKDNFGTDAAYQVEIVFDILVEKGLSAERSFEIFSEYVREHRNFLTDDLKMTLIHLANAIAISFHGANKSELNMLLRIQQLLLQQ